MTSHTSFSLAHPHRWQFWLCRHTHVVLLLDVWRDSLLAGHLGQRWNPLYLMELFLNCSININVMSRKNIWSYYQNIYNWTYKNLGKVNVFLKHYHSGYDLPWYMNGRHSSGILSIFKHVSYQYLHPNTFEICSFI